MNEAFRTQGGCRVCPIGGSSSSLHLTLLPWAPQLSAAAGLSPSVHRVLVSLGSVHTQGEALGSFSPTELVLHL